MTRQKIAIISNRYLKEDLRGSEEFAKQLIKIVYPKYDISLLTSDLVDLQPFNSPLSKRTMKPIIETDEKCKVYRFKSHPIFSANSYLIDKLLYKISKGNQYSFKNVLDVLGVWGWGPYTPKLFYHLIDNDYDLVHGSTFPSAPSYLAFRASIKKGIPYVYAPYLHYNLPWVSNSYVLKTIIKESNALIARTESEKQFLIKLGGKGKSTFVIPSLFDFDNFTYIEKKNARKDLGLDGNFIILTNPHPLKGGNLTLEAAGRLSKTYKNVFLISMGNPKRDFIKKTQQVIKRFPNLKIKNFGWVDNLTKWKLHAAADVLSMPSLTDSFGISYLDSWASETSVIGAKGTSAEDLISDFEDGYLVSRDDSDELYSRIKYLYENPAHCINMGILGKEKVKKQFNPQIISNLYYEAFDHAVSNL